MQSPVIIQVDKKDSIPTNQLKNGDMIYIKETGEFGVFMNNNFIRYGAPIETVVEEKIKKNNKRRGR